MRMRDFLLLILTAVFVSSAFAQDNWQQEIQEPLIYTNPGYGIRVSAPDGWMMYGGMRRRPEILVVFSRLPYEVKDSDNPKIVLRREKPAKKGPDSSILKAYRDAEVLGLMKNLKNIERVDIVNGPEAVDKNGRQYSRLDYAITERTKQGSRTVRSREYTFQKDGVFYVLLCGADPGVFDRYDGEFEKTAQSLVLD